jgi:hypothetical protein
MRSVLQASGASPLTFCASATSTSQPSSSRVSRTNRAPVIDSITPRTPALRSYTLDEVAQPVGVRRCRQAPDDVALVADQADVQVPATEIQSSVQHEHGPPRPRSPMTR